MVNICVTNNVFAMSFRLFRPIPAARARFRTLPARRPHRRRTAASGSRPSAPRAVSWDYSGLRPACAAAASGVCAVPAGRWAGRRPRSGAVAARGSPPAQRFATARTESCTRWPRSAPAGPPPSPALPVVGLQVSQRVGSLRRPVPAQCPRTRTTSSASEKGLTM